MIINVNLVQSLIQEQFPEWSHLEIKPVECQGWDNRTFLLGDSMLVRLPSAACYSDKVLKEQKWLPKLAPYLPLAIPTPVALGKPNVEYPWNWSIYKWIEGQTVSDTTVQDQKQLARDLAYFLHALQCIDTTGGPMAGAHNFYRGGLLQMYDNEVEQALQKLTNRIDTKLCAQIWNEALSSVWSKTLVWVHGDIAVGNLLVKNGRFCAVIDFGGVAIGDPACDYVIAWNFFDYESREIFKKAVSADEGTWSRARGWALWKALIVVAQLPGADASQQEKSRKILEKIIKEYSHT